MGNKQSECQVVRERIESGLATVGAEAGLGRHLERCGDCAQYAALRAWSHQVLQAGQVEAAAPLMSAVWASIHRASEQAWDSALTRSFRYLLPYMVAVVALILLVGGLTATHAPASVQAASATFSVLSSPEVPAVAGVMTVSNLPSQDPSDILGSAVRR